MRIDGTPATPADLKQLAGEIVDNSLADYFSAWDERSPLHWQDYVTEAWVLRRVREQAQHYVNPDAVVQFVIEDFEDEIIRQHQQPIHCKGQRQFKLAA